jgi:GT2 family glycosyltransferase
MNQMRELILHGSVAQIDAGQDRINALSGADAALRALEHAQCDQVLLAETSIASELRSYWPLEAEQCDLMHAGLALSGARAFQSIQLATMDWFFLDAPSHLASVSWKATPELCWVRPKTVRTFGGFDSAYTSATGKLMDLAYRILIAGGRVRHNPEFLLGQVERNVGNSIPLIDEFIFLHRHLGLHASFYTAFWYSLLIDRSPRVWRIWANALMRIRRISQPTIAEAAMKTLGLVGRSKQQSVDSISAIIPTINRYDYLPKAIESLQRQIHHLDEIIVIDQTPHENRRLDIKAELVKQNIKYIYIDSVGQSTARNTGVRAAANDWCLFFDDDSIAWDDLLQQHVKAVEHSTAQVSTGVSLAPWKTRAHIPAQIRHFHLANVLDTGNCLLNKRALIDVGGFDRAFDKGSGADNDIGTRLYLKGYDIVFNPLAIRTHYKAPTGGLRTHGAWWRNQTTFWGPYPPPTQLYTIRRFYPRSIWPAHYVLLFLRAAQRSKWWEVMWIWASAPWKFARAVLAARHLQTQLGWVDKEYFQPGSDLDRACDP